MAIAYTTWENLGTKIATMANIAIDTRYELISSTLAHVKYPPALNTLLDQLGLLHARDIIMPSNTKLIFDSYCILTSEPTLPALLDVRRDNF